MTETLIFDVIPEEDGSLTYEENYPDIHPDMIHVALRIMEEDLIGELHGVTEIGLSMFVGEAQGRQWIWNADDLQDEYIKIRGDFSAELLRWKNEMRAVHPQFHRLFDIDPMEPTPSIEDLEVLAVARIVSLNYELDRIVPSKFGSALITGSTTVSIQARCDCGVHATRLSTLTDEPVIQLLEWARTHIPRCRRP